MTDLDWSVLEIDGVTDVASSASRRVAEQYHHTIERDDAYQEALILLARGANEVRAYVAADAMGLLHHWLYCDLVNIVETEAKHRSKHISYERAREGEE